MLTRLEILSTEAGEELSTLIAKEIMGDNIEHQWVDVDRASPNTKYCIRCDTYSYMSDVNRPCSVMPYSECWPNAKDVIDKMLGDGFSLELIFSTDGNVLARFFDISQTTPDDRSSQMICESAAEAISRSALLAKYV